MLKQRQQQKEKELQIRQGELQLREAEQMHKDLELFNKPTDGMNALQLALHMKCIEKIKEKYGLTDV